MKNIKKIHKGNGYHERRDPAKARAMASHERSLELKAEKYLYYWEREFLRSELLDETES